MKRFLLLVLLGATLVGCGGGSRSASSIITLGADEFAAYIDQNDVRLVDVRTPQEYAEGHIRGAENIDLKADDFTQRIGMLHGTVAVYCRGGKRSLAAAEQLEVQGCTVYNLDGGIVAWQKAGHPVTAVEADVFDTPSGQLATLHALMHASVCFEYGGKTIYVDPVTRLGERTVDYSTMPKADIVLVTHHHPDHYDTAALHQLVTPNTQLIMNALCAQMYGSGQAVGNGEQLQIGDSISVEAVPAYNTTAEHLQFHPRGRDNGYVLTLGGLRVYLAGDTEDIPEMASLGSIDIAFLPCNQPFTMTPQQLVNAANMVRPTVLFPYHYADTDVRTVADQLPTTDIRIRNYQ